MHSAFDTIWFGSGKIEPDDFEKDFRIWFKNESKPTFEVMYLRHDWHKTNPKQNPPAINIATQDEGFIPLLKFIWHTDWDNDMTQPMKAFLTEMGFGLPSKFRVRRDI